MKASGIALPEVHSAKTMFDTYLNIYIYKYIQKYTKVRTSRAGIRCKKPQPVANITASTNKSHKIPIIQNISEHSMDFPVPEQLITYKTETITRRIIQDKNRELTFYPDPIYRPPPRPPENLQPNSLESKPDTRLKIDVEFKENSPYQGKIISEFHQRPNKSYF